MRVIPGKSLRLQELQSIPYKRLHKEEENNSKSKKQLINCKTR